MNAPLRIVEEPLGADAHDRPTLAEVAELWSCVLTKPVPTYPVWMLARLRRLSPVAVSEGALDQ